MEHPTEIQLIVNADDLGWSDGINAGILRACRDGIVRSATLAANMPAAEAALALARDVPELGVGVHLNACQGPALSPQGRQTLAEADGVMNLSATAVLRRWLISPRRTLRAVRAEFAAQIRWCIDHGLCPTHADTHRHLHALPAIFGIVADLCRDYDIPFVRRHREKLNWRAFPPAPARQRRLSAALNFLGGRCYRRADGRMPTLGSIGVSHTGVLDVAFLLAALEHLPPGVTELMVHPGEPAGLDERQTRLIHSRQQEVSALCDQAVKLLATRRRIVLTNYARIR